MEPLKLSIKPKIEPIEGQTLLSSGYSIKINDWELGRGVTDFRLEMPAGEKPKATITFIPECINAESIDGIGVALDAPNNELVFPLNKNQLFELAEYRKHKVSESSFQEEKRKNKELEKQLLITKVVLASIAISLLVNFIYQLLN